MTDWTNPETFERAVERATTKNKGNYFEAFQRDETIEHDPGLELTRHGTELWTSQTLNHDSAFWRSARAAERDYDRTPIHPDYLLAATMGPSVEDLSEKGGYFLGRDNVTIHRDVYAGTELRVESTVTEKQPSGSRPEYGIVTWETRAHDADSDEVVCSYERTNMIPRREPIETDGGDTTDTAQEEPTADETLPEFITPDGKAFEDFADAVEQAEQQDAAVAYRHERGRTMDDLLVCGLPLSTLNTAKQHHNQDVMADSPSGEIVAYGDVTRSVALAHARSDELTYRERRYGDEYFHDFVTLGDTIYGFTRVQSTDGTVGPTETGQVTFKHIAFNQHRTPVYSGTRTALIERRDEQ